MPVLELYPPPSNKLVVVSESPTRDLIVSTVQAQSWKDITFVVLRLDEANRFEISGSLEEGLSALCSENGQERVSATGPASLGEATDLLLSYLASDDRWRTSIGWE